MVLVDYRLTTLLTRHVSYIRLWVDASFLVVVTGTRYLTSAFLLDSIVIRCPIDLGNLMIRYMISSHSVASRVLPYGLLLTRIFSFHDLNLTNHTDRQEPRYYDTITTSTLNRMGDSCSSSTTYGSVGGG